MDSKLFLLLSVFALSVATFSQATPTNHQHTSTDIFYDAFMEIRDVSHAIREIFENFIRNNMECSEENLDRCKDDLTSLKLTALPQRPKLNAKTFDTEWKEILKVQVKGMRIFSKILTDLVEHNKEVFNGHIAERKQLNRLEQVNENMKDMVKPFTDKLEDEYCLEVPVELASDVVCEICKKPRLESRPMEIVRNYQFIKQMLDYVDQFKKTLFVLAWKEPDQEQCAAE